MTKNRRNLLCRRWLLGAIRFCSLFACSGVMAAADDVPTTADQIIARYMQVIGADRFPSMTTFAEQGEMFGNLTGRASEHANFEFYFKSPNLRFSSTITAQNKVIGLSGCDGRVAWYVDSRLKRTEFTPKPGKEFNCENGYEPMPTPLRDPEVKTRLAKKKEIQGRMAWEVSVDHPKSHVHVTYYFDTETYVLLRAEREGSHITYSDYRDVGGFKFPFQTKSEFGNSKIETTVREIAINRPIEDARFIEPNVKDGGVALSPPESLKAGNAQNTNAESPKPPASTIETEAPKVASEAPAAPEPVSAIEVNFPNFTVCTIPELELTVPELQGLKPATDQTQLSALLDKVGAKTVEMARRTPNLISRETVTDSDKGAAVMRYEYLMLNRIDGDSVVLDEFRVDLKTGAKFQTDESLKNAYSTRAAAESASHDLAASQSGRQPTSQGFASSWIHLSPANRSHSTFRFLGEQKMDGHRTLVLAFAQKPESIKSPTRFLYQGKNIPVFLQGVAWVDVSDFHIWRLRTDLLAPYPEVSLHRLTADIQFKPTRVEEIPSLISLPHEVKVTSVVSGSTFQEVHSYSNYRLFQARSKIVLNSN